MRNIILFFLLLFYWASLSANMAEPQRPDSSSFSGEFVSRTNIGVEKEILHIDLRPLTSLQPAEVSATYMLLSDTTLQHLELIFVANNLKGNNFTISVNGRKVSGEVVQPEHVPFTWAPPDSMEWSGRKYKISYSSNQYIKFIIPVIHGRNQVEVRYLANVGNHFSRNTGDPSTLLWNFVYILSPAKTWKNFKELDFEARIPEGWEAHSNLQLTKEGNILQGTFSQIPADALTLSLKKPEGSALLLTDFLLYGGWIVTLLVCAWLVYKTATARVNGKIKWKVLILLLLALIAFFFTFVFYSIYLWHFELIKSQLGNQLQPNFGRTAGYSVIGAPFIFVIAWAVSSGLYLYFKKRIRAGMREDGL